MNETLIFFDGKNEGQILSMAFSHSIFTTVHFTDEEIEPQIK